ncbi:tetratricopeptide repeat protein [Thiomicrospira microaerophila]|uniref:tetratricopeptide repeat protein n=1 Tax=Thiomicrospira microaerophila TaxID=406020 RepID=UPI00200DF946|nr:tetratricopeptide repeat protein [Thiomicrospira microaerophila]UQB42669.1 tetratricopeptide repeat protein [Thiomicrospira microaerophila]
MKRINIIPFFVLLIVSTLLSMVSRSVLAQERQGMDLNEAFDQAKAYYNARQFDKSQQAFEKLLSRQLQSLTLNFYLGQSALELKNYNQAMAAFDRVLILDPNHMRTRLELARLYFEVGQFQLAEQELDLVLTSNLPDNVRQNVLAFKSRLEQEQKRHQHQFTYVFGINHDTNATNQIGADSEFVINSPIGEIPLSGNKEVSDWGLSQTLIYNHFYDIGELRGWVFENQLLGFHRWNRSVSQNNLVYLSGSIAPTYLSQTYRLGFPVELDRVWLDSEDYFTSYSAGISLRQSIQQNQAIITSYIYRIFDYDKLDERDSHSHILNLGYRYAMMSTPVTWGVTLVNEIRRQRSQQAIDPVSLDEMQLRFDIARPVAEKWRLGLTASYRQIDYSSYDDMFASKRRDQITRTDFNVSYQLSSNALVSTQFGYVSNGSNQAIYDFDKVTTNISLIMRF